MDEDDILYEMFLELMSKLDAHAPDGAMRIVSQSPSCAEAEEENTTHKR